MRKTALIRLFAASLLIASCVGTRAWSQTDTSPKPDKEAAKAAEKATKEASKEAEKAIKQGNIDQLKSILDANPGLIGYSARPNILESAAIAVVITPVAGPIVAPQVAVAAGSGNKLLHQAATYNNVPATELLLKYGADINAKDGLGATPLHQAVISESWDVGRVLLDHGADVNTRWANGDSPLKTLRWERANRTRNQPKKGFDDFEQLLLQHGAY
jgi:ankyrin repeat protein